MKRLLIMPVILLLVSIAGHAYSCGYDECDPGNACSDYSIPCEAPDYIDDAYGPRSNFRLLVNAYAPVKQASSSYYSENSPEEFDRYQQRIRQILGQKRLVAVPLQYASSYVYGAHPCLSNNYENVLTFIEEAANDPGAASFLRDVIIIRDGVLHLCSNPEAELKTSLVKALDDLSRQRGAAEYAGYLSALYSFYTGDYRKAADLYQNLGKAMSPWIRETAFYMLGRTYLILSQEKWSGGDSLDSIDKDLLNKSEAAYRKYLSIYPAGRYSLSAKNIQRRIMFLRGDTRQLNSELERLFETVMSENGGAIPDQTMDEVFNFYHADKTTFASPLLTAYQLFQGVVPGPDDLILMRKSTARYRKYPGLQAFLINRTLFMQKKYQDIVGRQIIAGEEVPEVVSVALRTLYARACEQLGNYAEARRVWKQLAKPGNAGEYPHFLQVSLTRNYLKDNKIDLIARTGSGVTDAKLLREIFENLASDSLLENTLFSEKTTPEAGKIAQTVLLTRYVLQKRYPDMLRILKQVKDPGIFAQVETAARTLLQNEKDPKGLLNAGYFIYYHGIHPRSCGNSGLVSEYLAQYKVNLNRDSLEPPIEYFAAALEQFNENDKSEIEAKLLHYAVISFKPSNKSHDSTWWKGAKYGEHGKEWYERLHRKYPNSEWAKKTRYYYTAQ